MFASNHRGLSFDYLQSIGQYQQARAIDWIGDFQLGTNRTNYCEIGIKYYSTESDRASPPSVTLLSCRKG